MYSYLFAGMRKVFVLVLVLCLAVGVLTVAQADMVRTGSITKFSLLAEPKAGEITNYKVSMNQAGRLTAVLTDLNTGEKTTVYDYEFPGSKSVRMDVPGNLLQSGHSYSLDLTHASRGKIRGQASHAFTLVKPVAEVNNLTVTSSVRPQNGETMCATFTLPCAAYVSANVVSGSQIVSQLAYCAYYPAGTHTLVWNGLVSNSQIAPAGNYTVEVFCSNTAGNSAVASAPFSIVGDTSQAVFAQVDGTVESMLLAGRVEDGEKPTFIVRASKAGNYTLKMRDNATGKSVKMTGRLQAGMNQITVNTVCTGGREYTVQMVLQESRRNTGKAQLSFRAHIDPPSVSISAPSTLEAGYGAAYPITYTAGTAGNVDIYFTDASHTVIYSAIRLSNQPKGTYTVYWNGLDGAGNPLPTGTYHVFAESINSVGNVYSNSVILNYTGAVAGVGSARVQGAISVFGLAEDQSPTPAERTPVKLRVQTTSGGTLKITLRDIANNGKAVSVYKSSVSAGMRTITIPADYFGSSTYILEAELTSNKKVVGKAIAYVQPHRVDPQIVNFSCNGLFEGELQAACRFTFDTTSTGHLFVRIEDEQQKVVRTILDGAMTTAGSHSFAWNGLNDSDKQAPAGRYRILTTYIDSYGVQSNWATQYIDYQPQPLPEGVYGYSVVGKGDHRTPIYMYDQPNGKTIGTTYGMSAVFEILDDYGEWLRVRVSGTKGSPVECYVKSDRLQRIAITSPYRIEVNINRYGATAQTLFLYKDGQLIDQFKVSTGMSKGTTPTGVFSINTRRPYFTVLGSSGICYDTLYVIGGVCIHRVPMINGSYKTTEPLLGTVASHGCIRVPVNKSTWLYENIPDTTPVIIYSK